MNTEKTKTEAAKSRAEEIKNAITGMGETTLSGILASARAFKAGLGANALNDAAEAGAASGESRSAPSSPEAQNPRGEANARAEGDGFAVETVEYRAPVVINIVEAPQADAVRQSAQKQSGQARAASARSASGLRGKSRAEQMELIRRLADEAAEELPAPFFEKLSGGIALSEVKKHHPKSRSERPLLVLGEYRNDPRFGRSIMLYGGSIIETFPRLSESALKAEIRRIVRHEFTHHIESLCGERGLEIEDEISLAQYELGFSGKNGSHDGGGDPDSR